MSLVTYVTREKAEEMLGHETEWLTVSCPAYSCDEYIDLSDDEIDELLRTGSVLVRCDQCDQVLYLFTDFIERLRTNRETFTEIKKSKKS